MLAQSIASFRQINPAIIASQRLASEPLYESVPKKDLAMTLKRVAPALKISGSTYHILDILLGLVREADLKAGKKPMVAISNEKLAEYTMRSTRTVSRCIKRLVEAGILAYADSPNGRRFVCRDQSGAIDYGFGLDLTPACNNLLEFEGKAAAFQERLKFEKQARRLITSRTRAAKDLADLIGKEAVPFMRKLEDVLCQQLDVFARAQVVEAIYEQMLIIEANMSSEGDINGVAISNTTPSHIDKIVIDKRHGSHEPHLDLSTDNNCYRNVEMAFEKKPDAPAAGKQATSDELRTSFKTSELNQLPSTNLSGVSIGLLESACSDVKETLQLELSSWNGLLDRTEDLRHLIGLSEAAWQSACVSQGRHLSAACLVVVAEKALRDPDAIARPGGYFRAMIDRANDGKLHLQKSVFGLASGT
ncbi:plasmid replication protein RepC [Pseudovibrio sp. POLY-S9]|uniref:plasmid replication protein RepC n=1 Tax=Pseudovibrio sp. POLY-S9 TaxID=1576596 RepID=UPI00070BAF43|nr:plasmid replication protein RepC [Pseudovibrio sp. POLY-S9]